MAYKDPAKRATYKAAYHAANKEKILRRKARDNKRLRADKFNQSLALLAHALKETK